MPSDLLKLRRRAGYKSARDFAQEAGIPLPTYSRYESNPEKIPLKAAWDIADRLGTSIDVVVGRRALDDADAERGEVQREYDAFSQDGRDSMDEFRRFVRWQEEKGRADDGRRKRRHYDLLMRRYEDLMVREAVEQAPFDEPFAWEDTPASARIAFERFLKAHAADKRKDLKLGPEQAAKDDKAIAMLMEAWDRRAADEQQQ